MDKAEKIEALRWYIGEFKSRVIISKHAYLIASRWMRAGVDPITAASWARAGYEPEEAITLIRAGASWRTVKTLAKALTGEVETALWIESQW